MNETYQGTASDDQASQFWGEDVFVTAWLYGGNDYFDGAWGTSLVYGGSGNDQIWLARAGGTAFGDEGHDRLWAEYDGVIQDKVHRLEGGLGDDDLHASDFGVACRSSLYGGDGVDGFTETRQVRSDSGLDRFDGGAGFDFVEHHLNYERGTSEQGIVVNLATGLGSGQAEGNTYAGIEGLSGTDMNDQLTGDASANVLMGAWGADALHGGDGHDLLMGGGFEGFFRIFTGTYRVTTGSGTLGPVVDRTYSYTDSSAFAWDLRFDESSADTLLGGNGDDVLIGGGGGDRLDGGTGTDTASYIASYGVQVDLGLGTAQWGDAQGDSFVSIENLIGSDWGDRLTGNALANLLRGRAGDDTLSGGGGNDTLDGGAGVDRLEGGAGNDTYVLATSGDTVVELAGGGMDTVQAAVSARLSGQVEDLLLTGAGLINGTGNALANRLTGNASANILSGLDGNDTLSGAAGADSLLGGAGIDRLLGGHGADKLQGGAGVDSVTGGLGNDIFVFAAPAEAGDVITDFRNLSGDNDRFYISAASFGGGLVGGRQVSASQFQIANDTVLQGTAEANIRFIFEADATKLWFDSNGSASGGLRLVADLQAGATLTAADIWLM